MSQSMSLTKFTTHLDEGHSVGGCTLFLLCRHLENTLCQSGSCPPPRGCDIIKGENAVPQISSVQFDEIFSVPPLLLSASPTPKECLQLVPDESPRASRAEGRERVPRSTRRRRHCGRKGTKKKKKHHLHH